MDRVVDRQVVAGHSLAVIFLGHAVLYDVISFGTEAMSGYLSMAARVCVVKQHVDRLQQILQGRVVHPDLFLNI